MIARRSLWVVGNSYLGAALGYVALLAMARYMGAELLGSRAYVLAIVFLMGIVTRLGLPTTHARRLARGDDVAGSNGTYWAIKVGLTAAFLALAGGGMWIWFHVLDRTVFDATEQALWLGIAVVFVKSLRDVCTNTFRGLERIRRRESVLFTNTVTTVLLTVLVAIAVAESRGRWAPAPGFADTVAAWFGVTGPVGFDQALAWLIGAYLAGEIASFALALVLWATARIPVGAPSLAIAKDYANASLPIMVVTIAGLLMRRVDQIMVGFWHDATELGQYAAATKLSEVVMLLALGVHVVLLPIVARLQQEGRMEALAESLRDTERWISLLVWPVVVMGWLIATPILHIVLSDDFLPAATVLMMLLVHSLVNSITIPLRTKALGLGKQNTAAKFATAAVVVNIAANFLLVPKYGAFGAAIATVLAGLLMLFLYRRKAHEWIGHPILPTHLWKHAAAGGATYALLRWAPLPEVLRFYDLVWYGTLVLTTYVGILMLLGGLRRDDIGRLRRMVGNAKTGTEVDGP